MRSIIATETAGSSSEMIQTVRASHTVETVTSVADIFARSTIAGGPKVYDVTKYLNDHPGGPEIILDLAGD